MFYKAAQSGAPGVPLGGHILKLGLGGRFADGRKPARKVGNTASALRRGQAPSLQYGVNGCLVGSGLDRSEGLSVYLPLPFITLS